MLARRELLQQPHVPIEETGQTRGIAWHQTAVNDRTVLVLVAIVTQIRADCWLKVSWGTTTLPEGLLNLTV